MLWYLVSVGQMSRRWLPSTPALEWFLERHRLRPTADGRPRFLIYAGPPAGHPERNQIIRRLVCTIHGWHLAHDEGTDERETSSLSSFSSSNDSSTSDTSSD